jgi:glutamyl-tRNA synthetase
MTIIDSSFEDWKLANPNKHYQDFSIDLSRLNQSGALFDWDKLNHISNTTLSALSHQEFYQQASARAQTFDPALYEQFVKNPALAYAALNIERLSDKDPKRYTTFADVRTNVAFFFDELFQEIQKS